MKSPTEAVEFKTLDGLTLRETLYPATSQGPGVVMTPGFNCVKKMLLPEVAEFFQNAGVTTLIYDPRSIGLSDGSPRNEIDPMKQVEDYSDALIFLTTLPIVDTSWLFSGPVASCATALDKRAKLLITICPFVKFYNEEKRVEVLAKAIADRVSQAKGNPSFSVAPFNRLGDDFAGMAAGGRQEAYEFMTNVKERGAPTFENRTTLQSYYKIAMLQTQGLMPYVSPTPVMMLIPDNDIISRPEDQLALFKGFQGRKRLHNDDGKGHLNVLSGDIADVFMQQQIDFIRDVFDGKLSP